MDFLKLLLPLFLAPKNYYDVRQKLGAFVVYETWLATYILSFAEPINEVFERVELLILPQPLIENFRWVSDVNVVGLLIGIFIGVSFFIFHLHDRVSDLFRIRANFDMKHIIRPLSVAVSRPLDAKKEGIIASRQDRFMREAFYKYASSRKEGGLVDKHDIEQALESWSWFWVGLEGVVIWLVGAIISIVFQIWLNMLVFIVLGALYALLMVFIWPFLKRRARVQVEAIADNPTARSDIARVIDAL